MLLQLGQELWWLMHLQHNGGHLPNAQLIDRMTVVSSLTAQMRLRYGVLRSLGENLLGVAHLPVHVAEPAILGHRPARWIGRAAECHPIAHMDHGLVGRYVGLARTMTHKQCNCGVAHTLDAFRVERLHEIDGATNVVPRMLRPHRDEAQQLTRVAKIGGTFLQPLDGNRWWIRSDIATHQHRFPLLRLVGLRLDGDNRCIEHVQQNVLLPGLAQAIVRTASVLAGMVATHPIDRMTGRGTHILAIA